MDRTVGSYRNPVLVLLLIYFTFGLYWFLWFYKINAELRDHTPNPHIDPGLRLVVVHFIPIYNLFVMYGHVSRDIRILQEDRGIPPNQQISGGFLLWIYSILTLGIAYFVAVQRGLNRAWMATEELAAAPE